MTVNVLSVPNTRLVGQLTFSGLRSPGSALAGSAGNIGRVPTRPTVSSLAWAVEYGERINRANSQNRSLVRSFDRGNMEYRICKMDHRQWKMENGNV